MKKNVVKINESQLHNMIAKTVKSMLREWEDQGDESYLSGPSIDDCAHNLKTYLDSYFKTKGSETDASKEWLERIYYYAKDFIRIYEEMFSQKEQ